MSASLLLLFLFSLVFAVSGEGHHLSFLFDYDYTHMWLNIAASNGNADAVKGRDLVAKRMTAADISKAQALARECVKKNYKGC